MQRPPANRLAVAALTTAVLSLPVFFMYGIGPAAGILLGIAAHVDMRGQPGARGRGLATAAIVVGLVGFAGFIAFALDPPSVLWI